MARMIILFLLMSLPAAPALAQQAKKPAAPANKPAATPPANASKPGTAKPGAKPPPGSYVMKKRDPNKGMGGVTGRPVKTGAVVIKPKQETPDTGFTLSLVPGKPGHLSLAFSSRNPDLVLNAKTGFVAQIFSDEEVQVEPSLLTAENWPKVRAPSGKDTVSSDKVGLTYSLRNAKKGEEYEVQGEVAYTVCNRKTNVCEPRLSSFYLTISP